MALDFLARIDNRLSEKLQKKRPWLAQETQIPLSTINSWFANSRYPRVDHAFEIAKRLNVSVEYLMTGKKEKMIDNPEVMNIIDELQGLNQRELIMLQGVLKNSIPMIKGGLFGY